MTLWVNGSLRDDREPVLLANDHGVVVGDGVFETVKVVAGQPFARRRHLDRLQRSAAGLGLVVDRAVIEAAIDEVLLADVAAGLNDRPQRLRITVTGGPAAYGSSRDDVPPTIMVATAPMSSWSPSATVVVVPWTRNERSATAGIKTTSYADNVVALGYAHQRGATEAIFANTIGELCEGTGSNIFIGLDGVLVTPPLSSGCLAGVTRELLIEWLGDVEEQDLPLAAITNCDEAFLASSTRDVQAIAVVDEVPLPAVPGPLTSRAIDLFAKFSTDDINP